MVRIFAGIISFNPNINTLRKNINSICSQVEKVVIFDNGSDNQREIIEEFNNVIIIESKVNIGVAGALNRLLEWGENNQYQWMISLDQDSICEEQYVSKMTSFLSIEPNIGIAAPVILDQNIGIVGHYPQKQWSEVKTCITSGAFNNIAAWRKINGYDEFMFIDSVDFEYCYRLRKNGYKVIQIRDIFLMHKIGESCKKQFLFWKITVNGHNALRKYYIARNNIYFPKKHHLWIRFIRGNFRNIWLVLCVTLFENDKKAKRKSIYKGWWDGVISAK